jgi:hypothetical protein
MGPLLQNIYELYSDYVLKVSGPSFLIYNIKFCVDPK